MVDGCEGQHYARGYCSTHYKAWYRNQDPTKFKAVREPWQHGSATGYQNHGCRCDLCRKAHADYHREQVKGPCARCMGEVANRYLNRFCRSCWVELNKPEHGTEGRYKGGCRCKKCRKASATARRVRRQRQTADQHG